MAASVEEVLSELLASRRGGFSRSAVLVLLAVRLHGTIVGAACCSVVVTSDNLPRGGRKDELVQHSKSPRVSSHQLVPDRSLARRASPAIHSLILPLSSDHPRPP